MSDAFLFTFNTLPLPIQCREEWLAMLEFCAAYFEHRGVTNPVVLEIGTRLNQQKRFYEKLLGARHIGIDITDAEAKPDIIGDSTSPATLDRVRAMLDGRQIDLLFIDGNHAYEGVKRDYEIYAPLTRHIIAFHDVNLEWAGAGIKRFWDELKVQEQPTFSFVSIDSWTEPELRLGYAARIGIGLAVRKNLYEIR
jgi:hypothetical protein